MSNGLNETEVPDICAFVCWINEIRAHARLSMNDMFAPGKGGNRARLLLHDRHVFASGRIHSLRALGIGALLRGEECDQRLRFLWLR